MTMSHPAVPTSRPLRRRTRYVILAAVTVVVTAVMVPASPSSARAAVSSTDVRASAQDSAPASGQDAASTDNKTSTDKKTSTVRIRLGQTLDLTTLEAVPPGSTTGVGAEPTGGQQDGSWQLVSSPENTGLTALPPGALTFTPDVLGTYTFQRSPGKANGAGAVRTLVLEVSPDKPLVCVNTRTWPIGQDQETNPPGMKIGDEFFPRAQGAVLQMVVLDRRDLGHPSNLPVNISLSVGEVLTPDLFESLLFRVDNSHLVFVTGVVSSLTYQQVWLPLQQWLGATIGFSGRDSLSQDGVPFSVIGVPGTPPGSAWQAVGTHLGVDYSQNTACDPTMVAHAASNLGGWLTLDTTGVHYGYVSPDFIDFDSEASAPAGHHTISVGNETYTVATGDYNGFHAVVLDRRTLCATDRNDIDCNPGTPLLNKGYRDDQDSLAAMTSDLTKWENDPNALLFLATFNEQYGGVGPDPSTTLITTLRDFGASPLSPGNALDNEVRYALVGGGGRFDLVSGSAKPLDAESFTNTASNDYADRAGHIVGTLIRDHQNRFAPRQASLAGSLTGDNTPLGGLGRIVYGNTTPWPEEGHPDLEAAFNYLDGKLRYTPDWTIRDQYTTWLRPSDPFDPNDHLLDSWCTTDLPPTVTAAACVSELQELHNEFLEVKYVLDLLANLNEVYTEVQGFHETQDTITDVEDAIKADLTPPPTKTTILQSVVLPLAQIVLSVASAAPMVGPAFRVAGAVLSYAESLGTADDGSSIDPMQAVYQTGDKLTDAMDAAFTGAIKQIHDFQPLIVTDYGKLTRIGHLAANGPLDGVNEKAPWSFTQPQLDASRTDLETALKAWLYPPLVDVAFPLWHIIIPSGDGYNDITRTPQTYRCTNDLRTTHPFGAEPDAGWIELSRATTRFYFAMGGTRYDEADLVESGHHPPVPDAVLLTALFDSIGSVGLGRAWYFEHGYDRELDTGTELTLECEGEVD